MTEKKKGYLRRAYESVGKTLGLPKPEPIKETRVAVLGVVEQSIGVYELPSFSKQVDVFKEDPLINEGLTMFAEQVVATGAFLTFNPEYKFTIGGKTAFDIIKKWYDDNNIDTKLLEIAIELKAFGNSFWRINNMGFIKIPIEAAWHMIRVESDIPLQEKYNLQLHPLYGAVIIPWKEFIHFKKGITGRKAPFGTGVIWGLLATPIDSTGRVSPSLYDIRLSMRSSLHEGFRKFSFGNELWIFEGMSNEDFQAVDAENKTIGERLAEMKSTGNRIATNAKGRIELAVPERTQSYDEFIKQMRDEFFMSLADPSLKLGLEQGFTKATSITASEIYKYKVSTFRKVMKEGFEDLFKQILDDLGYDGYEAGITLNFGPEETAEYLIKDIFEAEDKGIILKNEARLLLSKYHKWDISGDIEGGDKPVEPKAIGAFGKPAVGKGPEKRKEESVATIPNPQIVITPLSDAIARYNGDLTKIYIDPIVPEWMYTALKAREIFQWQLEFKIGMSYDQAEKLADVHEKVTVISLGQNYEEYQVTFKKAMELIKTRQEKVKNPEDCVVHK